MKGARVSVLTAVAGLGLLGLTACGSDSSGSPSAPQQNLQPQAQAQRANLVATEIGALGMGVTDQEGRTLYRFDKDTAKPPVSNCNDACANAWPPLIAQGKELTFTGVDQKAIGTTTRKDGTKQVTINGWPMYTYAKDTAPGDANGQGVGGTWFVSTPEGKKAQANVTAPTVPQQPKAAQNPPPANPPANNGSGY
jgi:predicted lipoprotein with Yx(FWY)xxD motif